jgi:phage-related protein
LGAGFAQHPAKFVMIIDKFDRSEHWAMPVFSENLQIAGRSFFEILSYVIEHFPELPPAFVNIIENVQLLSCSFFKIFSCVIEHFPELPPAFAGIIENVQLLSRTFSEIFGS